MIDYAGAIHFHSAYSYDSHVPLPEIIKAAIDAGLDYAVLTDHFRLDARTEGLEGYHTAGDRRMLLMVGEEISPRYNHYLALGIQQPIVVCKRHPDAQKIIDRVQAEGGFGFIAHPDQEGAPFAGVRAYPWVDWNVKGFAGLSIWDLMDDWTSQLSSVWQIFGGALRPGGSLRGPRRKTLARWDELTRQFHCVAIGEVDNHGNRRSFWGIPRRIFPFEFAFRTIRTHVLLETPWTGDAAADTNQALDALRLGHSYVSLDLWNDPKGFLFRIYDEKKQAVMGEEFIRSGPDLLEAKVPGRGRTRLIRDGRVVWEDRRRSQVQLDVDLPGVYRIEVDQHVGGRWRPWIFSNPIWVK